MDDDTEYYCGCEHHRPGPDAIAHWDEYGSCTICGEDVDPWTIRALQAEDDRDKAMAECEQLRSDLARLRAAETERVRLRKALVLAADTIQELANQQEMVDNFYELPLKEIRAALASPPPPDPEAVSTAPESGDLADSSTNHQRDPEAAP